MLTNRASTGMYTAGADCHNFFLYAMFVYLYAYSNVEAESLSPMSRAHDSTAYNRHLRYSCRDRVIEMDMHLRQDFITKS